VTWLGRTSGGEGLVALRICSCGSSGFPPWSRVEVTVQERDR